LSDVPKKTLAILAILVAAAAGFIGLLHGGGVSLGTRTVTVVQEQTVYQRVTVTSSITAFNSDAWPDVILSSGTVTSCTDSSVIEMQTNLPGSPLEILNNVWGDPDSPHLQCIYRNQDSFGWYWFKPTSSAKPFYPDVILDENTQSLPIRVASITNLEVGVVASVSGHGRYNFILDIAFTNGFGRETDEMMIFLMTSGPKVQGREQVYDGHNSYSYFTFRTTADNSGVREHVFALEAPQIPSVINIEKMLQHMAQDGYTPQYVSSISLGNEVFQGNGSAKISEFTVTLNGQTISSHNTS
jgi:hypothetical protein